MVPQFSLDAKINENDSANQSSIFISFTVNISLISTPNFKKISRNRKGYYAILWVETSSHKLIDFKRIP